VNSEDGAKSALPVALQMQLQKIKFPNIFLLSGLCNLNIRIEIKFRWDAAKAVVEV